MLFLWTFNDFNTPYVLFGNGQPPGGDLISFHIYNASFLTWNFGIGSAMSVLLLLFLLRRHRASYLLRSREAGGARRAMRAMRRPRSSGVVTRRCSGCSPSSRST